MIELSSTILPTWSYLLFAALLVSLLLRFVRKSTIKTGFFEIIFRLLGVVLLLLALLEPYRASHTDTGSVSLLVDISASMNEQVTDALLEKARVLEKDGLSVQVKPFAKSVAKIATPLSKIGSVSQLKRSWEKLNIGSSDISSALREEQALGSQSSLLISDGYQTIGSDESRKSKSATLSIYPLIQTDTVVTSALKLVSFRTPIAAAQGDTVPVRLTLHNPSAKSKEVRLRIFQEEDVLYDSTVTLAANQRELIETTSIALSSTSSEQQTVEFKAVLTDSAGAALSDDAGNEMRSYTGIKEKERILLLSGTSEDQSLLVNAFSNGSYTLDSFSGSKARTSIDLKKYSSVLLNNIPKNGLPNGFIPELERFVRSGNGVVMIGGNRSFGLGGYIGSQIEAMMPVSFVPPRKEKKRLNVAVVLVVDKSRSMSNNNKMRFVKDAARLVIQNLKDDDYISVIGFDTAPFVVQKIARVSKVRSSAVQRIERLYPVGQTNPLPALDEARRTLQRVDAGRKHVVFLTDGEIPAAQSYYTEMAYKLKADKGSISTVMLGSIQHAEQLRAIANAGGGSFYHTANPRDVPNIFLKDINVVSGEKTLKEQKEFPVSLGNQGLLSTDIRTYPDLLGFVVTKMKKKADQELVVKTSDGRQPLLASWKYGEGKAIAFTSDANGRWSRPWISRNARGWRGYVSFWRDILETVRGKSDEEGQKPEIDFEYSYELKQGSLALELITYDSISTGALSAQLTSAKGSKEITFTEVKKGVYQSLVKSIEPGRHALSIAEVKKGSFSPVGFYLPGTAFGEQKGKGFNTAFLSKLAGDSNGKINPSIEDLEGLKTTQESKQDLTWIFILAGLFFLLGEVFVRERWRG